MADVSYVPGNRTAIAGDCCWLLIDAAHDSAVVSKIWPDMEHAPQLDALAASLLRSASTTFPTSSCLSPPRAAAS